MVRCADCGFLGLRHSSTREVREADPYSRESGKVPSGYSESPVCCIQAAALDREMGSMTDAEFARVVNRDRDCPKHFPWWQGFSPKEHVRMHYDQMLRDEAAKREREMREWQAEQRQKDQEREDRRRSDDLEWQRRNKRSDRWWAMALIVLAAIIGLAFEPFKTWLNNLSGVTPSQRPPATTSPK
jgi:hypothetical protein